jgi:hypothetical protein
MKDGHTSKSLGFRGGAMIVAAIGAVAIGVLAIGRLAIRHIVIDSAKLKSLEIEDLTVKRQRAVEVGVSESLKPPAIGANPKLPS